MWIALREAWRGLLRYPLRTALTLLGLVIGVGSVVATLSLLASSHRLALDSMAREGGLDVVTIESPEWRWDKGQRLRVAKRTAFDPDDARRFRESVPGVRDVGLQIELSVRIRQATGSSTVEALGVESRAPSMASIELVAGRFLTDAEDREAERVAVLSVALKDELFGRGEAVGREVLLDDQRFTVVGVARLPADWMGEDVRKVFLPRRTALLRLGARPEDTELLVAVAAIERLAEIEESCEGLLARLRPGIGLDSYDLESWRDEVESLAGQARMRAIFLGGVAALALLTASSGILNTLLVGVRERTVEIGTRRALGARRRTIVIQFLAEAVALALPGAAVGLVAGALTARAMGGLVQQAAQASVPPAFVLGPREALAAIAAALLVAGLAGLWPAWQASRVSPAEALRYE